MYVRKMKYGYGVIDFAKVIELAPEGSKLKEIAKQEFDAASTEYNDWEKAGGSLYSQ